MQLLMYVIYQVSLCTRECFCCHHPTSLSSPLTISHPHERETEKQKKLQEHLHRLTRILVGSIGFGFRYAQKST